MLKWSNLHIDYHFVQNTTVYIDTPTISMQMPTMWIQLSDGEQFIKTIHQKTPKNNKYNWYNLYDSSNLRLSKILIR